MLINGNEILDDKYELFSISPDPFWPFGITEQEEINMQIKIENGIEIPRGGGGKLSEEGLAIREAVKRLDINQSFLLPGVTKENVVSKRGLVNNQTGNEHMKKFITRLMPAGLRIWRIQ